jgi:hypothetical protein
VAAYGNVGEDSGYRRTTVDQVREVRGGEPVLYIVLCLSVCIDYMCMCCVLITHSFFLSPSSSPSSVHLSPPSSPSSVHTSGSQRAHDRHGEGGAASLNGPEPIRLFASARYVISYFSQYFSLESVYVQCKNFAKLTFYTFTVCQRKQQGSSHRRRGSVVGEIG